MFEPIGHLQMLRRRALLVRFLCRRWAGGDEAGLYAQSALVAWRLSRVLSGWLSAHPNRQYHPTGSPWFLGKLVCASLPVRAWRWSDRARTRWLARQLRALGRECADIRSVTSSGSINEMLGRHQPSVAALQSLACARVTESVSDRDESTAGFAKRIAPAAPRPYEPETWPFLSI
jgi:hypothetical protein